MLDTLKGSLTNGKGGNVLLAVLCFALILVLLLNFNNRIEGKMDRDEFLQYLAMTDKRDVATNIMLNQRLLAIEESMKEIERLHRSNGKNFR